MSSVIIVHRVSVRGLRGVCRGRPLSATRPTLCDVDRIRLRGAAHYQCLAWVIGSKAQQVTGSNSHSLHESVSRAQDWVGRMVRVVGCRLTPETIKAEKMTYNLEVTTDRIVGCVWGRRGAVLRSLPVATSVSM